MTGAEPESATTIGPEWVALGELLKHQRVVVLKERSRAAFARRVGVSDSVARDLEEARRVNFDASTLLSLERWYALDTATLQATLGPRYPAVPAKALPAASKPPTVGNPPEVRLTPEAWRLLLGTSAYEGRDPSSVLVDALNRYNDGTVDPTSTRPPEPPPKPAKRKSPPEPIDPNALLLTFEQAATQLGLSESWLRRSVTANEIPHRRLGKLVRFSPADIESIREAAAVTPSPATRELRPSRRQR